MIKSCRSTPDFHYWLAANIWVCSVGENTVFPERCRRWYACWLNADQRSVVRARRDTHRTTHKNLIFISTKQRTAFMVAPVCMTVTTHDQLLMGFKPQSNWNAVAGSLRATWKKTFTNINELKPKKTRPTSPLNDATLITSHRKQELQVIGAKVKSALDSECQRSADICLQSSCSLRGQSKSPLSYI